VGTQALTGLAALAAFALDGWPGLAWPFVALFGFGTAARDVVFPLALTHAFGVRDLARIYGVLTLLLLPAGVLGPYFAGEVFDHSGSYQLALGSFAALMAVSAAALAFVRPEGEA
jgi:cyanate permease